MADTDQAMQLVEDVENVGPGTEVADPRRQWLIAQYAARMGQ